LARTLAIELRREEISVNTVLYESLDEEEVEAIASLLAVYRSARRLTGQETYVAHGANLGRAKP
jgi:hypothetical protein